MERTLPLTFARAAAAARNAHASGGAIPGARRLGWRLARAGTRLARAGVARLVGVALAMCCCAVVSPSAIPAEDGRLVVVASVKSPIATLSSGEVRRLYLGIPITHGGREITALINGESQTVKEMFLQHVLFMSAQAYERQLSGRLYRTGGNRIAEFKDLRLLLDSLAADPLAVTFMQSDAAARQPAIKILGDL